MPASMAQRPRQKEKTQRAFGAYLELVDTADWIRRELCGPLESFGITMGEFRLLLILRRDGRVSVSEAAKERGCRVQNVLVMIADLEKLGCVRRESVARPPVKMRASRLPKWKRGKRRTGRRVVMLSLTPLGERVVGKTVAMQAKLVKSYMRVLNYKQQGTLMQLCRKLREGDIVKFISEVTHADAEEDLVPANPPGRVQRAYGRRFPQ